MLNLPNSVSNASWTTHTKTLKQAARELIKKELQNAELLLKRYKQENGDLEANTDSRISDEQLKGHCHGLTCAVFLIQRDFHGNLEILFYLRSLH